MVSETHSSIQSHQHYEGSKIPASSERIYLESIFCLRGLCQSNNGPLQTHIQLPTQKRTKNNLTRKCITEKELSKMNSSTSGLQLIQRTTKFTGGREKPWIVQEFKNKWEERRWNEGQRLPSCSLDFPIFCPLHFSLWDGTSISFESTA